MNEIEIRLDWLTITSITMSASTPTEARHIVRHIMHNLGLGIPDIVEFTNPQRFYPFISNPVDGLQIAIANSDRQGVRVTMSGNFFAIHDQAETGVRVAKIVSKSGWRVTRTDIATDVYDTEYTAKDIDKEREEMYTGRSRTRRVHDEAGGYTLYVGSRESEKMLRVYDKGVESGLERRILRFEMEYKGNAALPALVAFLDRKWGNFAYDYNAFIGVPDGLSYDVFRRFNPEIGIKPIEKETSLSAWFKKSVIPALNKARDKDEQEYREIMDMLRKSGHMSSN